MKYALSVLRVDASEGLVYLDDRYDTREEAEKALAKMPKDEQDDYGIAEVLSKEEIAALEAKNKEESDNV